MGRKGISIDEGVHARGDDIKREGESWSDLLGRAFDALEAQDDGAASDRLDEIPDDILTEGHIDDVAAEVERRVERTLENLSRP